MRNLIFLLTLLICTSASAEWEKTDKILYGTYLASSAIDLAQTYEILEDDRFNELNPWIDSKTDACLIIGGEAIIVYLIADRFPKIRRPFLSGCNAVSWGVVINNHSIGVRIKW